MADSEKQFGEILKTYLDEHGISQKWLAEAANTQEATISRYCTGANKSSRIDILANIAKALNVSSDYLLGITDLEKYEYDTTADERLLIEAFRRADARDINIIWQILSAYLRPSEKAQLSASRDLLTG